ncbi:VPS35 endosomal protein-sorting factor-like isoform X1 [Lytechinus variegatus]|uniref:VPS35 endosomal protein-sorting factor-like isoform X1 n=1 Tax=Lytechinus variegatus TaxID=7654 RepID=UPI001BB135DF|nr:VPS35 endosomal protein-sorting factor-like isoform X1 [Lytechinus variegatus]XP_041474019.1 VPS35 endosomal protein-sorting factor-like isoform X1 [Lytechinus variegatus]
MATYEWHAKPREYEAEKRKLLLKGDLTVDHPLKPITVHVAEAKLRKSTGRTGTSTTPKQDVAAKKATSLVDPLSSALEGSDPLSQFAAAAAAKPKVDPLSDPLSLALGASKKDATDSAAQGAPKGLDDSFEPWSSKKAGILSKYTTSEKLSITTSFLSPADREKVTVKTQVVQGTVTDKVKNRLEQLDDFEEGSVKEMLNLSQQEYVYRIEELNQALINAWDLDQKVKALKIAIQCSKLLADISVIQFYPSKFVLITDILDTFGRLVYDRIRKKSTYLPPGSSTPQVLPVHFTPEQVPNSAKETCRNWFFKIASIRELIPRLYVETAILKCYSFLTSGEYSQALLRLTNQMRGIGDPLVAIYARAYLCRVGMDVAPNARDHLISNYYDFLGTYTQLQGDTVQNILAVQRLDMTSYLSLYSPALDWILQSVAYNASEEVLTEILDKCKKQCNSALLLNSVMSAFKPEYIGSRAIKFIELIKESQEEGFPKHNLYRSLGTNLTMTDPPEQQRLSVLNEVWKAVMKLKSPSDYISCAEVWIEYPCRHFTKKEVNTILGDIIKHMTPDRAFEQHYPQLQSVMSKVLSHMHNFSILFVMDKFLPFVDMFQKDSVKVEICKTIMEAFCKYQEEQTRDPVIVNAVMFICKTMHDSINALTLDDERRDIGALISGFIRKINYGRDFEQQLSFYVESRANFSNLDAVLVTLVQCVNSLAAETCAVMKGNHSRKTSAFVRACAAYSFITIPSIVGIFHRLNLYLASGQVAVLNQALTQADAFFKAAISLIPSVPRMLEIDRKMRPTESLLLGYVNNFLSTLLTVPDNPEQGCLYLLRGLLNVFQDYAWDTHSDAKVRVYMNVLCLLSAQSQDQYAYHVKNVDSNDALYGSDRKFLGEVNSVAGTLILSILDHCKTLGQDVGLKRQAVIASEFFEYIILHGDIDKPAMSGLALNLWNLAQKNGQADTKYMVRLLEYVKRKGGKPGGKAYADLSSSMTLQTRT